jgi:hypothetical protein
MRNRELLLISRPSLHVERDGPILLVETPRVKRDITLLPLFVVLHAIGELLPMGMWMRTIHIHLKTYLQPPMILRR